MLETFHSITDWRKRNWGSVVLTNEKIEALKKHLYRANVSAACDGSVSGSKSAHAWSIYRTDTGETIIQGCAPVDGIAENMTSTRTEMMGILAVTTFLSWFSKTYSKITHPIDIYSDSKSAIQLAEMRGIRSTKYALYNDVDCVMELQATLKRCPFFQLIHVRGHQDEEKTFDELDIPSQNNVKMDKAVGQYITNMDRNTSNHDKAPILPAQKICLISRDRVVSSMIRETLIDNFVFPTRLKYLNKHLHLNATSTQYINWSALSRLLKRKGNKKGKYAKMLNNQWNTMQVNNRWDTSTCDKCPLCDKEVEDSDHVLRCKFRTIIRVREEHVRKLTAMMKRLHTHEDIIASIVEGITSWMSSESMKPTPSPDNMFNKHLKQAIQEQNDIGWGNMIRGYIAIKWSDLQEMHYKQINAGKGFNRRRWENEILEYMTRLGKNIWKERCDIVKLENNHTNDARTREAAFLLACELRKEAWRIPTANRAIINKPKKFFYESNITQILNWEQSVSKALKAATLLEHRTKSKITSWITYIPISQQDHRQQSNVPTQPKHKSTEQKSLFTYLTRPSKSKFQPNLETINEEHLMEILKPTGKDHLLRKYNKYRKDTGTYIRNFKTDTNTTSKYIQFRIDRYVRHNVNFSGPIN